MHRNDKPDPFFDSLSMMYQAHCEIFSVDTDHRLVVPWQDICYLPQARCVGSALYVDAHVGRGPTAGGEFLRDCTVMKRHDICVNGSMVKEGFTVSSSSESAVVERMVERKSRLAVSILRLVNTGELYVTLQQHATGIERMQEEIQNVVEDK
ncbi:hypothetical protein quinque_002107 [Culex quinquefasciatus]